MPHASKGPLRLKAIVVALSIHSFWLFRGLENGTNLSINGCDEGSLITPESCQPSDGASLLARPLRAVSTKERAHIDQASKEVVRLLIILLLLLALATYYINPIMSD